MLEHEQQIRNNVHQMLLSLWPDNPDNLQNLPPDTDRQNWFNQFIAEKRQQWQHKCDEFQQYGRLEDAHKEAIKLNQLELSLQSLTERNT